MAMENPAHLTSLINDIFFCDNLSDCKNLILIDFYESNRLIKEKAIIA